MELYKIIGIIIIVLLTVINLCIKFFNYGYQKGFNEGQDYILAEQLKKT